MTEPFALPAIGEPWPTMGRLRCCDRDWGGSHYHCPACGRVSSMYGCVSGKPMRRRCTDTTLPDQWGDLMSSCGPWPGGPPWAAQDGAS